MSFSTNLSELKTASNNIQNWVNKFLPDKHDSSRCFEFSVYLNWVNEIANLTSQKPIVKTNIHGTFAGSPGDRSKYNYIEVGDYILYFGVKFSGQSKLFHAPDIVISHKSEKDLPLFVIECKHYSGEKLQKQVIMAFVGLLCDLNWAVFQGCKKKNTTGLYPGNTLKGIKGTCPGNTICNSFNRCKSILISTIPPPSSASKLEERYEFEIKLADKWKII